MAERFVDHDGGDRDRGAPVARPRLPPFRGTAGHAGRGGPARMAPSDFERSRQDLESRNERISSWIGAGAIFAGALVHLGLRQLPDLHPRPPWPIIGAEFGGALILVGVLRYLRRAPSYHPSRKYVLSALYVAIASAILHGGRVGLLAEHEAPVLPLLLAIPVWLLLIVLSALRYSTGAVLATGGMTAVAHLAMVASVGPLPERIPAMLIGLVMLTTVSATVSYLVQSLLRLHHDSVSKERLRRFLAPEVVDEIMAAPQLARNAVEAEVTVLFADISGFTELSSRLTPTEVIELLNEYFPEMSGIVFRHRGTLEKYIGDALLAVWGAPLGEPDDAARAVRAAVEMQRAMVELNRRWRDQGRPSLQIHIGLHTGRVAAGHIGTDEYLQYATIGDTTNLASRICAEAPPGEIVMSEATRRNLPGRGPALEEMPPVQVKGKAEALVLHRLVQPATVLPLRAS